MSVIFGKDFVIRWLPFFLASFFLYIFICETQNITKENKQNDAANKKSQKMFSPCINIFYLNQVVAAALMKIFYANYFILSVMGDERFLNIMRTYFLLNTKIIGKY